jgi:hypothetical protein
MRKTPYNMLSALVNFSKELDGYRWDEPITLHTYHSMTTPKRLSGHGWTIEDLSKDMIRVEFDFSNLDNVVDSVMAEDINIQDFDPEKLVAQRQAIETVYNAYIKPYLYEFWRYANDSVYLNVQMNIIPIEIRPDEITISINCDGGGSMEFSCNRNEIFNRASHANADALYVMGAG